uniref:17-beta-hydroxysteroid dehydrogenase type 6-like n=1 Tax=Podarcis muralis TaxID=64176 RepID=UPI00109F77CC|nr:17-beta-hydroxysteroid dehydrogenase type 6-like [Podarcis muralis]XP_028577271.1 17-beta-hydroxysteroid dehydrogenase type 6-like [Podarcis muralis]
MWLYLAALLGLYFLHRWYQERQTVENLTEKYVFITGCSSGFGNHLARHLDARGLQVLATCTTQKGAEQLDKVTSERLKTTVLDVTSKESVAAATEWVKEQVGNKGLWGLVNNAGTGAPSAPSEWLTKDGVAKMIGVNFLGMIDMTLHMLPLVRRARGRVVNMSSIMGRLACFSVPYTASKYSVEAFSDVLRREIHPFGVRVSIIEPGSFKTPIQSNMIESYKNAWSQAPSDIKEAYGQRYFERSLKLLKFFSFTGSSNFQPVTDSIEHALTSCSPHIRYCPGWDAKLLYVPLSYLPDSIFDFLWRCIWPKPAQAV